MRSIQSMAIAALAALGASGALLAQPPSRIGPGPAVPGIRVGPPAAPQAGQGGFRGRGVGGGVWGWGWPWGWGREQVITVQRDKPEETAPRPWVENKDYKREVLSPITKDFPEGTLPAPKLEQERRQTPCRLVLTDGSEVESERCERRAEVVLYENEQGRRIWLSQDLIDWAASRFEQR